MAPNSNQQSQERLALEAFNGCTVSSSSSSSWFVVSQISAFLFRKSIQKGKDFVCFLFQFLVSCRFISAMVAEFETGALESQLSRFIVSGFVQFHFQLLYLISKRSNGIMTFYFVSPSLFPRHLLSQLSIAQWDEGNYALFQYLSLLV